MSDMKNQEDQVVVDARGFACPEPVMMARSALLRNKDKAVRVLVDTVTSKDNLMRLANREKRVAEAQAEGDHWVVLIS